MRYQHSVRRGVGGHEDSPGRGRAKRRRLLPLGRARAVPRGRSERRLRARTVDCAPTAPRHIPSEIRPRPPKLRKQKSEWESKDGRSIPVR